MGGQAVAHGEEAVGVDGLAEAVVVLEQADRQAAHQVDGHDHHGGDGVATDELGGPVHGPVEVGFGGHLPAPPPGLVFVDEAAVEVGVYGHLLAGHAVEGEAGRHLGHPAGTVGDHDELDHDDDEEHHQAHDDGAPDHKVTEGGNDVARFGVEKDLAGHAHVEGQAVHGGDQQQGGENGELEGPLHVHARQHDDDRTHQVEGDQ